MDGVWVGLLGGMGGNRMIDPTREDLELLADCLAPPYCFLAQFSAKPCEGRLIKAHLLPRQLLKREFPNGAFFAKGRWWPIGPGTTLHEYVRVRSFRDFQNDPRSYVWACGGTMGNSGHHGAFDTARTLRVPRQSLPAGLEQLALDLGLDWYLIREFGPICQVCGDSEVVYVNPGYPDPQTETDYPCPRCSKREAA